MSSSTMITTSPVAAVTPRWRAAAAPALAWASAVTRNLGSRAWSLGPTGSAEPSSTTTTWTNSMGWSCRSSCSRSLRNSGHRLNVAMTTLSDALEWIP